MTDTNMPDTPMSDVALPDTPDDPSVLAEEDGSAAQPNDLDRSQKRLLKRLYNARTTAVMADDRPFLTYKDALRYLLSLPQDARDLAYAQMKTQAKDKLR